MRSIVLRAGAMLLAAFLGGCASRYQAPTIDASTGLYDASTEVDPGGVLMSKSRVNPTDFGAVLLLTNSNIYPSHLEFMVRGSLNDLGYKNVINVAEWKAWASDRGFVVPEEIKGDTLKDFSVRVKPLLIVDMRHAGGGERTFTMLRVVDGRTLESLLVVSHPRTVWVSFDKEAIYPVLNELRKWHRKATQQPA